MNVRTIVFIMLVATGAIISLLNMIRKRKLEIKYALPWLILYALIIIATLIPGMLNGLAELLGITLPINMLFFFGFCLSLSIIFGLTISVSRLSNKVVKLAQEVALLREAEREKTDAS